MSSFLWQTAFGKRRTNLANFTQILALYSLEAMVGEIERQIFRQRQFAGAFLLGEQSLVKSTPDMISNHSRSKCTFQSQSTIEELKDFDEISFASFPGFSS